MKKIYLKKIKGNNYNNCKDCYFRDKNNICQNSFFICPAITDKKIYIESNSKTNIFIEVKG